MKNQKRSFGSILVTVVLLFLVCALVFTACAKKNTTTEPDNTPGDNAGDNSGDTGTGDNTGNTGTGDNTGNTGTGDNTGNTGDNTGNTETGDNTGNTGDNTGTNTGDNTGNTGDDTGANTGDNTGNTGDNTGTETEPEPLNIREDLMPFYNLLTQKGDKAFAVTVNGSGTPNQDCMPLSGALKVIVNTIGNDVQFALTNAEEEDERAYVRYLDGELNVCGTGIPVGDFELKINDYQRTPIIF